MSSGRGLLVRLPGALRRLLRPALRGALAVGQGPWMLRQVSALLRWACGLRWVQQRLFGDRVAVIGSLLRETGIAAGSLDAVIADHLWVTQLNPLLGPLLHHAPAQRWAQLCRVEGEGALARVLDAGRGAILLHQHTPLKWIFTSWGEYRGLPLPITLWKWSKTRSQAEIDDPKTRATQGAAELLAARSRLLEGGVVEVLADGYHGGQGIMRPFLRRRREFQPAFAELALMTGAAVLPVAITLSPRGVAEVRIGPELLPAAEGSHVQRLAGLVDQYATFLEQRWQEEPKCITFLQIQQYLALPTP